MMNNPAFKQTIRNHFFIPLATSVLGGAIGFGAIWFGTKLFGFDSAKLWPAEYQKGLLLSFFFMFAHRHGRITYQNLAEQNILALSARQIARFYTILLAFYLMLYYLLCRSWHAPSTSLKYAVLMTAVLALNMWLVERDINRKRVR